MVVKEMSEASVLAAIETLQTIQKNCPPTSREWQESSKVLRPLFAEMARRYPKAPVMTCIAGRFFS